MRPADLKTRAGGGPNRVEPAAFVLRLFAKDPVFGEESSIPETR